MKNLLIATAVIIVIAVAGYLASKKSEAPATTGENEAAAMQMSGETMAGSNKDMDLSGIHIMGDGSVMLGDGTTLTDASVNADGMIVLGDGTEVEPMMDMRQ